MKTRLLLGRIQEDLSVLQTHPDHGQRLYDVIYATYIPVNDFLINTPGDVAEHCRKLATIEKRNSRLQEALAICRQRLEELHSSGMAMDVRNGSVDEEGFHFSYKLWNKYERQQLCVMHSDIPTSTT